MTLLRSLDRLCATATLFWSCKSTLSGPIRKQMQIKYERGLSVDVYCVFNGKRFTLQPSVYVKPVVSLIKQPANGESFWNNITELWNFVSNKCYSARVAYVLGHLGYCIDEVLTNGMCYLSSQGLFVGAAWRVYVPRVMVELLILMPFTLQTSRLIDWYVLSLGLWGQVKLWLLWPLTPALIGKLAAKRVKASERTHFDLSEQFKETGRLCNLVSRH